MSDHRATTSNSAVGKQSAAQTATPRKYMIGKMKQICSVVTDPRTGLQSIDLKKRPDEKVYGVTKFLNHYQVEKKLGQGTFGSVYLGSHLETQRQVAMKRILINEENDLFPITAQREITILKKLDHKNIIKLIEMVFDSPPESHSDDGVATRDSNPLNPTAKANNKFFYMILPYMVSDLAGILHNPRISLSMPEIKNIMLQLLEGVNYLHCTKYMHRDIKTANILIDHNGTIKLADFGLARLYYGSPPNLKFPGSAGTGAKYTSVVVTRWYRAPELVLGEKHYTTAVDIWGVGCVFAEFFEKKPILQGTTDIDQGHVIFKLMGTPTEEDWKLARYLPGAELTKAVYKSTLNERFGKYLDDTGLQFLAKLLALDPYKRYTAMAAMQDDFFKKEPLPAARLELLCEESHESDIKRYKEEMHQNMSQRAPTAPRGHVNDVDSISKSQYDRSRNNNKLPLKRIPPSGPAKKTPNHMGENKEVVIEDNSVAKKPSRYNTTKMDKGVSSLPPRPNKMPLPEVHQTASRFNKIPTNVNTNEQYNINDRNNGNTGYNSRTNNNTRNVERYNQNNYNDYNQNSGWYDKETNARSISFNQSRYQRANNNNNNNKKSKIIETNKSLEMKTNSQIEQNKNTVNYTRRNSSHGKRYEKRQRDDYDYDNGNDDNQGKDISDLY
ncbi:similar to Saccharomyces cerevisiae YPR161C SGV1 Cyclin (Bur2p)-dependent protein kinase that functions in transcriptional regulation [Maudiozyma barnettii]|uniref:Serine/threonine-protein kinase BUR1 n=1 Tax=Maudiozyma barnettii TaxID=61262 RepID=A0A8H2VG44_9SACH|nr:cyclin-dependent serine/threonine protein kinase SGV1 [Kazachstania barnettii]CAB4254996.1 similar to Saccharomyces cerevisiae YPR161C SGV1 Cyclin (Bur2p)-dependent protein kinase that functions in transcriptional regulation [Kazachstania barnettii]CAD1783267.1 similar to Saccharomyces cerevisiae YPR161C SGV1 Cyclin (Bur2p)-dependent protein kinase that functions in transcriptional regulation [Kazachstania barnettii]